MLIENAVPCRLQLACDFDQRDAIQTGGDAIQKVGAARESLSVPNSCISLRLTAKTCWNVASSMLASSVFQPPARHGPAPSGPVICVSSSREWPSGEG